MIAKNRAAGGYLQRLGFAVKLSDWRFIWGIGFV